MPQRPRLSRETFPDWAPTLLAFLLASFVVAVLSACADDPSPPLTDPGEVAAAASPALLAPGQSRAGYEPGHHPPRFRKAA